eukprot:Plantae.Rhodophyta-Rhodochaete_pulchella.ctg12046.p1 GENE.Plantae.Rhodophyta-Rhodochaete_pulchella.ctg12046~~Plantae.Rhodophyta-Rhodochaete_pulchella.ctg12046.p1  ORF type:complete len:568 (-),score=93.70 Plantae.Rhodophyta-Rhodochaete_pulchella.ctg12046:109-1734(-)
MLNFIPTSRPTLPSARYSATGLPRQSATGSRRIAKWTCAQVVTRPKVDIPTYGFDTEDRERFVGAAKTVDEYSYEITDIEGRVPRDIVGTMYRSGAGNDEIFGTPIPSPTYNGDGIMAAVQFKPNGKVHFQNRYIDTEHRMDEMRAGKVLYRTAFGLQKPGGWMANFMDFTVKNNANIGPIYFGDRLLATFDGGWPYRLDPQTLETIGPDSLNGTLRKGPALATGREWVDKLLGAGDSFCAHSKVVGDRLCAMSYTPSLKHTDFRMWEFDTDYNLVSSDRYAIDNFALFHDQVVTDNYRILYQSPAAVNFKDFFLGLKTVGETISFDRNLPTKIHIFSRHRQGEHFAIEVEPGFAYHAAGGYEDGDELVYDAIIYPDRCVSLAHTDFDNGPIGYLTRFRIDLRTRSIVSRTVASGPLCTDFCLTGVKQSGDYYKYVYGSASGVKKCPFHGYAKFDMERGEPVDAWFADHNQWVSDHVFVPRQIRRREDDGWLVGMVHDGNIGKNFVVILDASDMSAGPVAKLNLPHGIPPNIHSCFVSDVF